VDFVDKQDILAAEIGQDSGEVAGAFDGGARRGLNIDADFSGNDMGKACLAEAGGAIEKDVVQGFTAGGGRVNSYLQVFLGPVLSGKISEAPRAETGIKRSILSTGFTRYNTSYFGLPPQ